MAYGLEIWDAAGNKTLSITDRIARYHGTYTQTLTNGASSMSISVSGFDYTTGNWFFAVTAPNQNAAITAVSGGFSVVHPRSGFTWTGSSGSVTIVVWRN